MRLTVDCCGYSLGHSSADDFDALQPWMARLEKSFRGCSIASVLAKGTNSLMTRCLHVRISSLRISHTIDYPVHTVQRLKDTGIHTGIISNTDARMRA